MLIQRSEYIKTVKPSPFSISTRTRSYTGSNNANLTQTQMCQPEMTQPCTRIINQTIMEVWTMHKIIQIFQATPEAALFKFTKMS